MKKKVLLLGANGQLGTQVKQQADDRYELHPLGSAELDISKADQVNECVRQLQPELIINAAAYTQVDQAESEIAQAFAVNTQGIENLARAAQADTPIIHISTDFVFDGQKSFPYLPTDSTSPANVYGRSKLEGERILRELKPHSSIIIRTAWLYSAGGSNFLNTMLRLMASKESLSVVADQVGTPTNAASLARVIWLFTETPGASGIYHWTDKGEASWYDFARQIQRRALDLGLLDKHIPVEPITTDQYPTPARRPKYSVLDKRDTWNLLGYEGAPWQEELQKVLLEIKQQT